MLVIPVKCFAGGSNVQQIYVLDKPQYQLNRFERMRCHLNENRKNILVIIVTQFGLDCQLVMQVLILTQRYLKIEL
jgi:hypothetical protein